MRNAFSWNSLILLALLSLAISGCGKDRPANLLGRWYSNDVSIRFRQNGSVLYNSPGTGLVEGRYRYDPALASMADAKPQKNLTVWLPQPGQVAALEFELRFLGNNRIELRPIIDRTERSELGSLMAGTGVVLKRASGANEGTDTLDNTPPLVSASPNNPNPIVPDNQESSEGSNAN